MPTLAIHFARFGPYHLARITAAARELASVGWTVVGIETGGEDGTYAWRKEEGPSEWKRNTVFPGEAAESISAARLKAGVTRLLDELKPDAVAIAGWGTPDARSMLGWCRKNRARAIVMSETREADGKRIWWKEWLKARIVGRFDAALVGAKSHRDYLVKLGIPPAQIHFGYDVVDNGFFAKEADRWRSESVRHQEVTNAVGPHRRQLYFLASNRFIDRKNLSYLITAYAQYVKAVASPGRKRDFDGIADEAGKGRDSWNLCLLGDGELKERLQGHCRELGLTVVEDVPWAERSASGPAVFFPGFRQIEELPRFYAHAGCFVHPALEEPWGLVLNEAMACGLPVLCSNNAGAAEELVEDGRNGWCFDPLDESLLSDLLGAVSAPDFPLADFGLQSARLLEERAPLRAFGQGLKQALGIPTTTPDSL